MPSDFRRIRSVLLQVRAVPASQRPDLLDRLCAGEPGLRAEVESLLAHDDRPSPVLGPGVAARDLALAMAQIEIPERIGPYRVLGVLGEGGMGIVLHAEQVEPLRREVALKLLRMGGISEAARARFAVERDALAKMEHPGIARVFDAGTDERGWPYVAMELVRGDPITRWCDDHALDLRARVSLVREVALAVQHAHQKGVLHRDLKPSNILVEQRDGRARPRIIDFGIAKALEDDGADSLTLAGQLVGTPEYMSPEQAGWRGAAVDTRSDLYALGILLYELATGDTPLGRRTLEGRGLTEILAILREHRPVAPARRLASFEPARTEEIARLRRTTPRGLSHALGGEFEHVVMRALEFEPDHRYATADEMANDLGRWLAGEAVLAGPPSRRRVWRALVRRHRGRMVAAALVGLVLVAGAATTTWQALRADRERDRAQHHLEDIRRLTLDLLFDLDNRLARVSGTGEVRRHVVETTVAELGRIAADPRSRARLRGPLGVAYRRLSFSQQALGDLPAAREAAQTSLALAEEEFTAVASVEARRELARALDTLSDVAQAEGDADLRRATLERAHALLDGEIAADDFEGMRVLIRVRRELRGLAANEGRVDEHLAWSERIVADHRALVRALPGDANEQLGLAQALRLLADAHTDGERYAVAGPLYAEAVAILDRQLAERPEDPRVRSSMANTLVNHARQLALTDDLEAAIASLERAIAIRTQLAQENPEDLGHLDRLASDHAVLGETVLFHERVDQARAHFEQARDLWKSLAERSPENVRARQQYGWAMQLVGRAQMDAGDFESAHRSLIASLAEHERILGEAPTDVTNRWRLASVIADRGHVELLWGDVEANPAAERREHYRRSMQWFDEGIAHMRSMQEEGLTFSWQDFEIEDRVRLRGRAQMGFDAIVRGAD